MDQNDVFDEMTLRQIAWQCMTNPFTQIELIFLIQGWSDLDFHPAWIL